MILPVGKPIIEIAKLDADDNIGTWQKIDTPKEGTTSAETQEGDRQEYLEEGGGVVDSYTKASKYSLSFELYAKKGFKKPIEDKNGVITDNYAIRLTPEDPSCFGFILHKCSVSCVETYNVNDGLTWKYTFNGLVSKDHTEINDPYIKAEDIETDKNYDVASATEGEITFTATLAAGDTLKAVSDSDWATATVGENGAVKVSVTANTTSEKRTAWVTLSANGKSTKVKVIQAASE